MGNGVCWVPRSGMMAEYQSAVGHCAITAPSFRILQSGGAGHPALLTTKTDRARLLWDGWSFRPTAPHLELTSCFRWKLLPLLPL